MGRSRHGRGPRPPEPGARPRIQAGRSRLPDRRFLTGALRPVVVPDAVLAALHDGARRNDGDGAVGLEDGELDLLRIADPVLAHAHLDLLLVATLPPHHVRHALAPP